MPSSITFHPVASQHRRKDGTFAVQIRITFNRKHRYLATNISASQSDLTRSGKIKGASVLNACKDIVDALHKRASRLNFFALQNMDVDAVVELLLADDVDGFRLDFPTYASRQIERMGRGAKNYRTALRSFVAFVGVETFDISVITSSLMSRYEAHLVEQYGKDARAVSLYTNAIARFHSLARREYNDEERGEIRVANPFARYTCPKQTVGEHRNAPPSLIDLMLYYRNDLTGRERLGVDVFLLSFALMGMNAPDLYECARMNANNVLQYNRRKTRERRSDSAEMRVRVEECVRPLVDEYKTTRGKRMFVFSEMYSSFEDFGRAVNIGLHAFERRLGLSKSLTLYTARHTWATVARSRMCNVDKSVVNDCICHVDAGMRVTDIYAEKDWNVIFDANALVLRLFSWNF